MSRERALGIAGGGLVVLALTLAAGLFFKDLLPLPQPRRYLGGDFAILFYTAFRYVAEEVGAGQLPHWTPYVGVGYPLLADIQTAVFYPPIRLLTLVTGPPSYLALELYAIAHYVLAGLGMLALGRQAGLPLLAASLGAVALMFSGFFWGHVAHLGIIQAAAWLPWLLAAHARALVTRSPAWRIAAGGLLALVVLGGHPQVAFYAGVALGLSSLTVLQSRWRGADWWTRLRIPATTGVVVLLGLALAAPQLLPTLRVARSAARWTPSTDFLAIDTLPLEQLLTLLVPFAYFATDRFLSADEFVLYVGTGTLLLAAAGVVLRRDVWSRYFALLAIVGLALALGPL
ncbi:MAG TPA: hypothetical protein VGW35_13230, partial [Methylomirabilota bacterium]|nr:hypothetical protein [Methylomirabilota bacterium]